MGDAAVFPAGDSIFTTNAPSGNAKGKRMELPHLCRHVNVAFPSHAGRDRRHAQRSASPSLILCEHDVEIEMTHVTADIIFRTIFRC
jgi:hypothetical protein